jgi:hypothetical protein
MSDMPAWASEDERTNAESILVRAAEQLDAVAVGRLGREIIARLDQDGDPPTEAELARPANEFRYAVKKSGRVAFTGEVDPETGSMLTKAISALSAPMPVNGVPDVRTIGERQGDAFADLVRLVADGGSLPEEGGQKPHVTVTISLDDLRAGVGTATLATPHY